MDRRRLARFGLIAAALGVSIPLARHWPNDHTVHYVLGCGAPRVEEVDARWACGDQPGDSPDARDARSEDWTREASFRYAPGKAPRVVAHELLLADRDCTVEIEMVTSSPPAEHHRDVIERRVVLGGGVTSIDLAPLFACNRASEPAAWCAGRP